MAQIAASIAEFGFTNPILTDGERSVIAGHGRLAAARKLELTEVPVIELTHFSAIQKKAYILADNRKELFEDPRHCARFVWRLGYDRHRLQKSKSSGALS